MPAQPKLQSLPTLPKSLLRSIGASRPAADCSIFPVSKWLRITLYELREGEQAAEIRNTLTCLPIEDGRMALQLCFMAKEEGTRPAAVISIEIHPQLLAQWPPELLSAEAALRLDHTAEHELPASATSDILLQQITAALPAHTLGACLQVTEWVLALLRRALGQIAHPFSACPVPACRFLLYESEREKIWKAHDILNTSYDERISIKALAQKVAMNECYLKKGFKTLIGCTIHEYISKRRIAAAQRMLEEEGRSVTEVAALLGYSSISHFSMAFRQATGIKPCALLR